MFNGLLRSISGSFDANPNVFAASSGFARKKNRPASAPGAPEAAREWPRRPETAARSFGQPRNCSKPHTA
eukprot:15413282-Alexandrium_andersonii.AAC.1